MTFYHSLSVAGFAATAISYGPGRMGFGLFVPEFKAAFSMSSSTVGIVSGLGFMGFFIGLVIAQVFLDRKGPKFPVLIGLAAATLGTGIVAVAPDPAVLAVGVFLAGTSAGFAWTPFNDAVHRKVRDVDRPTALSQISTGTSAGIALAGTMALAMVLLGYNWRVCWALFAGVSALALFGNWAALRQVEKSPESRPQRAWGDLLHVASLPLFGVAFVYGITSAIYISFAADRFGQMGPADISGGAISALVFIFYGIFGLSGLVADRLRDVLGLAWLLRALFFVAAASLALAALLPGSWFGLVSSAGMQGINVMVTSATLAFWSERLFPAFPSFGFTVTLLATAAGSVIGPVCAGIVSSSIGSDAMFLGTAAVPIGAAAILQTRFLVESSACVSKV